MKMKFFFVVFLLTGIFSLTVYMIRFDHKGMNLSAENVEAFAGIVDVTISPDSQGYCRCKNNGCFAGNMISFRANCGHNRTTTYIGTTVITTNECSSAEKTCK